MCFAAHCITWRKDNEFSKASVLLFADQFTSGAEPTVGQLVKVTVRPIKTIVGEVREIDVIKVKVFDLKTQREEEIPRAEIKAIVIGATDQETIPTLTPAQIVAYRMSKTIPRGGVVGKVAAIDSTSVYLTVSKGDAVRVGDEMFVYRGETEIKNPETGEVIGRQSKRIGRVTIIEVNDKLSKAKLVGDLEIELQVGDRVEPVVKEKPVAILPVASDDGAIARGSVVIAEELSSRLTGYGMPIVERSQLFKVMGELGLQQSALFEVKDSQVLGKQLGAAYVVVGRVVPNGRIGASLTLRVVDVASGKIAIASTISLTSFDFSDAGDPSDVLMGTPDATSGNLVSPNQVGGAKKNAIKLIKKIADATFHGKWSLDDGVVENLEDLSSVALPVEVSGSYSISVEMQRKSGDQGISIYLPVGERAVLVGIGHGGQFSGGNNHHMNSVEGELLRRDGSIPNKRWIKVKVDVTITGTKKARIQVKLDEADIFDWTGNPNDLIAEKRWAPPSKRQFALTVLRSRVAFRNLEIQGASKVSQ